MKNDFKPVVGHRFNLRGDWGGVLDCEVLAVEPNKNAVLHLEFQARRCGLQSAERGDLYAHANEHGDPPAHGAVGLPAGSEAGLRRRQRRMAAVLREAGAGLGADGLKSAASRFSSFQIRGGLIELEYVGSADSPLAVDRLYGDRHRQLRRHGTGRTSGLGRSTRRCSRSFCSCSPACTCSCCRMPPSGAAYQAWQRAD